MAIDPRRAPHMEHSLVEWRKFLVPHAFPSELRDRAGRKQCRPSSGDDFPEASGHPGESFDRALAWIGVRVEGRDLSTCLSDPGTQTPPFDATSARLVPHRRGAFHPLRLFDPPPRRRSGAYGGICRLRPALKSATVIWPLSSWPLPATSIEGRNANPAGQSPVVFHREYAGETRQARSKKHPHISGRCRGGPVPPVLPR